MSSQPEGMNEVLPNQFSRRALGTACWNEFMFYLDTDIESPKEVCLIGPVGHNFSSKRRFSTDINLKTRSEPFAFRPQESRTTYMYTRANSYYGIDLIGPFFSRKYSGNSGGSETINYYTCNQYSKKCIGGF